MEYFAILILEGNDDHLVSLIEKNGVLHDVNSVHRNNTLVTFSLPENEIGTSEWSEDHQLIFLALKKRAAYQAKMTMLSAYRKDYKYKTIASYSWNGRSNTDGTILFESGEIAYVSESYLTRFGSRDLMSGSWHSTDDPPEIPKMRIEK